MTSDNDTGQNHKTQTLLKGITCLTKLLIHTALLFCLVYFISYATILACSQIMFTFTFGLGNKNRHWPLVQLNILLMCLLLTREWDRHQNVWKAKTKWKLNYYYYYGIILINILMHCRLHQNPTQSSKINVDFVMLYKRGCTYSLKSLVIIFCIENN